MNKIEFSLKKINTKQFAIVETSYDNSEEDVALEMGLNFGINAEELAFVSIIKFQFKQNDNPFLIIEVSCEFTIETETWNKFLADDKRSILFPKSAAEHLAIITVGTIRGILHTKTENTQFNSFLLPTINLKEMITENIEFEL